MYISIVSVILIVRSRELCKISLGIHDFQGLLISISSGDSDQNIESKN